MVGRPDALKPKAAVSWSTGKDSAYALLRTLAEGKYDVIALLTTVTTTYNRVSMHGVRQDLLLEQARRIGLPVVEAKIPSKSDNATYEASMANATQELRGMGVTHIIFGDIFLQDVRDYRESKMRGTGIEPVFPLWGNNTKSLAEEIISSGIKARIVSLDPTKLDRKFGGSEFDMDFLRTIPKEVDPCGEKGEFHTLVYDAPFFRLPIPVTNGDSVDREGFYFTDVTVVAR
ncbi:MAG: diphthine--ammonia ligase [Thermoplasmataceae archaeon]